MSQDKLPGNAYVKEFSLPSPMEGETRFTSVVVDADEFDRIVDEISRNKFSHVSDDDWAKHMASLRSARHIPAIMRGQKTGWLFTRFGVTTRIMGVMQRDMGASIMAKMLGSVAQ